MGAGLKTSWPKSGKSKDRILPQDAPTSPRHPVIDAMTLLDANPRTGGAPIRRSVLIAELAANGCANVSGAITYALDHGLIRETAFGASKAYELRRR
jgi:hypothetical protein